MNRRVTLISVLLIVLVLASLFVAVKFAGDKQLPEFFVGIEFAYAIDNATGIDGLVSDLKGLVNEVKSYTNLFVIGTPKISLNQAALNESCDYIYNAGLHFIVLFTDQTQYVQDPFVWTLKAREKYGDMFLGVYHIDEPGGKQLDSNTGKFVLEAKNYTDAASNYVQYVSIHLDDWIFASNNRIFTSDYALYWFDYKAGYATLFTEFGFNLSRQMHIGLCRGAAQAQNRDWGAIVTWTYDNAPYIESPQELYSDVVLAYKAGAKYAVVFDYPKTGPYGILTQEHLNAMKNFWTYMKTNPQNHGANKGNVAYVLPKDYGFGFRNSQDSIWGVWNADELAPKVWSDLNQLTAQYGSSLDIVYDEPAFADAFSGRYKKLFFWNQTIPKN